MRKCRMPSDAPSTHPSALFSTHSIFHQLNDMAIKKYFSGRSGVKFWLNAAVAALVLVAVPSLALFFLDIFTHHGEKIEVPDVSDLDAEQAIEVMRAQGLTAVIEDSNYNVKKRAGVVLLQTPAAGSLVKSTRTILLTINRNGEAPARVPDIIRNLTVRIAQEQLTNLGFRLTPVMYVDGEPKDLVVGLRQGNTNIYGGDMVGRDRAITILAGAGFEETDTYLDTIIVDSNGVATQYNADEQEEDFEDELDF